MNGPRPSHRRCLDALDAVGATVTALRERFGPQLVAQGLISAAAAAETVVSHLRPPKQRQLADTTHPGAAGFGVTRELFALAGARYEITRRWATALHAAGAAGIRYQSRFTTTVRANAFALFDSAGLQPIPNR